MKFICQFHLFLMLFICCFSCVNHSRQFAESDAKICQNNKVADEYIVHWKNLKPTLVHTLDAQKYIKKNSDQLIFIEPNYRSKKQKMSIATNNTSLSNNYFFRALIETDTAWKNGYLGQGIQIAVVDSGVDISHPQLRSHLVVNQKELAGIHNFDDDDNGFIDDIYGWNFISNQQKSEDEIGHGTAIAGLIVGDPESPSLALAPKAQILAIDFMAESDATEFHAEQAISYALSREVQIINNSWTIHCSVLLKESFNQWNKENVIFVNASGNEPIDVVLNQVIPASFNNPNMINVGSSDQFGQLSIFSGYGNTVSLFAPGEGIPIIFGNSGWDLSKSASGTSFSAGIVSGAAALIWSAYPKATAIEIIALLNDGAELHANEKHLPLKILNIKKSFIIGKQRF